ncbi:NERD domain-containing protein/DEAD/DEAH box helicase [Paenibacillus melissococcoides]|uniref:NERD domain-containing protein/DEAD/DEAH box helicase n=1 Tax=Paenibacillus melissococcoides TaxID=2912268 RepID=A0ABM9FUX2_9BACL|nr:MULTISPECIES: NERD domain-containing protein/DEAD/DEAH box helicase [Paenibacillus]MEB9897239.1 NERD domain-containing protein/DEAD/DEAH box helicase [Bacillus cereus]CAH8242936.1 NERD domain-containing protein/DEAD/DEAH box helicase [Paenibacillus melissococcoides]CAH8703428.1 NERD domain-containing protein/DEAD/DEAH box helicase [Paenibacillus melissococcoides]CAH8706303.1 NERD domain-containing protein/DEAD/DEAH box helicase [Paenibacillus melissococcoides]GIO82401.1 hypothetical protein
MARMIPPYISNDVKSNGERQVFDLFKQDPKTRDWTILHSLALTQHAKRLYGEIDFLVLAPRVGVFCLEVKSGSVTRRNGIWNFTNRYGQTSQKTRGPFEQAQEGMFSLLSAIKKKFGSTSRLGKLLYGYGVMFPHIRFQAEGADQENWLIYDRDSRRLPISEFIQQLSTKTAKKMQGQAWFDPVQSLPTMKDINQLVNFLRGDFERVITPVQLLEDIEVQITKYTEEQFHCLDQLQDNPRCLFLGAAGTGKTMIAMESVRRSLFEKKRVLLICFNTLLGEWLSEQLAGSDNDNLLKVTSFHRFMEKIAVSSPEYELNSKNKTEEYFKYDLPLMVLEMIDRGVVEPFDKIVIDEGQDLIRSEYLDIFDGLLKGGLSGGEWEIYCDFERQAIYSEFSADEMKQIIDSRASAVKFRLTVNCRNTKMIGEQTSILSGFDKPPFLPGNIDGLPVEYFFCNDAYEETTKVEGILRQLKLKKIPDRHITILSPYKFQNSCISVINKSAFDILDLTNLQGRKSSRESITFSTIQGFKGLENHYIILTGISRLNDDEFRSLLYVGMSRAKSGLYMMLDKRTESDYRRLIQRSIAI